MLRIGEVRLPIIFAVLTVSVLFVIMVSILTTNDHPPKFIGVVLTTNIFMSLVWLYIIGSELVSVITFVSYNLEWSQSCINSFYDLL